MRRLSRRWSLVAVAGVALVVLAACGKSSGPTSNGGGAKINCSPGNTSATCTVVDGAAAIAVTPNWIFPMTSFTYCSVENFAFFQEFYRPLYWFGNAGQPTINYPLSVGNAPTFSNGDETVTITLKPNAKWSDGTPVTARDVVFWLNLLKAAVGPKGAASNWCGYVPGQFPDNLKSWTVDSPTKITLHMSEQTNQRWLLYNELSQIYPLPQHAWDKTSTSGAVGNADMTPAGALKVFNFLISQAKNLPTYATNPLWKVVDGPYTIGTFNATCQPSCSFVKNTHYWGTPKPTINTVDWKPFTSDTSEFSVLSEPNGGGLDIGYIPPQDISLKSKILSMGYKFATGYTWQITYFPYNFTNPALGPTFKQLYFRQAFQSLVNQPLDISKAQFGLGWPTYGPVPVEPPNPFASSYEKSNPYPFSVSKAVSLLKSNGWTVNPGGTDVCTGNCGTGVAKGTKLNIDLLYASGSESLTVEMDALRASAAQAGIHVTLAEKPFNTIIGIAINTNPSWQMADWGGGWIYAPDYYPTGEELFLCPTLKTCAASDSGAYQSPTDDALIRASDFQAGSQTLTAYENYLAKQLPVVWMPTLQPDEVYRSNLHGATPLDPLGLWYPENFYYTK
jgi:peptide/nickel transport system substrate-binding protein